MTTDELKSPRKVIVVLTPHAGVWPHAVGELALMDALVKRETRVIALTCDGLLAPQCTVMYSRGVNANSPLALRKAVCHDCQSTDRVRRKLNGVEWVSLRSLLAAEVLAEVETISSEATPENLSNLVVDDISIGTTSAYETLVHAKARPLEALCSSWETYVADLRGALICLKAFQRLVDKERVDSVLVYNGLYASNRAVWEFARGNGIPALDVQAISHPTQGFEYLRIEGELWPRFQDGADDAWARWREIPLGASEVSFAHQYMEAGVSSTAAWAYSPARTERGRTAILDRLGLSHSVPTVVVLLNSLDERIAATFVGVNVDAAWPLVQPTPLNDFLDTALQIARERPDWQFIIRVHPRMAAGKRDSVTSPELAKLERQLESAPQNVAVDWPHLGLSLFDIAIITDCALSIGTTAGLQLMALGIPTVLCNRSQEWAIAPDLYLPTTGEGLEDVQDAITRALTVGPNLSQARRAYRFIVFQHLRSAFRVLESTKPDYSANKSSAIREFAFKNSQLRRFGRRLINSDPTGLLSAFALLAWSRATRSSLRSQVDGIITSHLSLEPLCNEIFRVANGDQRLDSNWEPKTVSRESLTVETAQLVASLTSLYSLLGVPIPERLAQDIKGRIDS